MSEPRYSIPFVNSIFRPSDFLLAVLATDGVDDYQGGIAPCRLARTTADAKTLKLETEQVAPFSQIGYSILPMVDAIRL